MVSHSIAGHNIITFFVWPKPWYYIHSLSGHYVGAILMCPNRQPVVTFHGNHLGRHGLLSIRACALFSLIFVSIRRKIANGCECVSYIYAQYTSGICNQWLWLLTVREFTAAFAQKFVGVHIELKALPTAPLLFFAKNCSWIVLARNIHQRINLIVLLFKFANGDHVFIIRTRKTSKLFEMTNMFFLKISHTLNTN